MTVVKKLTATAKTPLPRLCWVCGRVPDPQNRYCRCCGKGQGDGTAWHYRHWGIIVRLLCLEPFARYFVWRAPAISGAAESTG